jgi:DNA-binding FadR family transcriptional regulator
MSIEQHRALHEAVRTGDGAAAEAADRVILQRALQVIVDTFEHPATT